MVDSIVLDIGNSRTKAAVFKGMDLIEERTLEVHSDLVKMFNEYTAKHSIIASSGEDQHGFIQYLQENTACILLNHETKIPFTNGYESPETLGKDRLAGVAGAIHFFPNEPCLIIDAGTCLTMDLIDETGFYQGGSISPGYQIRLQAMHQFTARLPLVEDEIEIPYTARNTHDALRSGAFHGMLGEINQRILEYSNEYKNIHCMICGGDAQRFGKHIKNRIFAAPQLVLYGLNKILHFNVK